jgi:membrane-anchored glycerophosphoryl diester phosphodiesterase (GDPDase)
MPIGGLLLTKKEHVERPMIRNILIGVSLTLFSILLFLIGLIYVTTDEGGNEIIVDLILLILSASVSGSIIYVKGKAADAEIEKPEI